MNRSGGLGPSHISSTSEQTACGKKDIMPKMGMSRMIYLMTLTLALCYYDMAGGHGNSLFDERGWARAGQFLTEHMDRSKAPCEHFYEHVCGKYGEEDGGYGSATIDQNRMIRQNVVALIEKIAEEQDGSSAGGGGQIGKIQERILNFYRRCLSIHGDADDLRKNLYAATNATAQELLSISGNELDQTAGSRWRVVGRLEHDFSAGFSWSGERNDKSSFQVDIRPTAHGTLIILLTGFSPPGSDTKQVPTARKPISLEQVTSLVPTVDWLGYFGEILGTDITRTWLDDPSNVAFYVTNPTAINETGRGLNEMDSDLFSASVGEIVRKQVEVELLMKPRIDDIEQLCLNNVIQRQPSAIGLLYLRSIGSSPSEWRSDILTVKRHVFAAFQFLLNSVDWLDDRDKEKVHSKLDEVSFYSGIPDWTKDTDKMIESMKEFTYDNQSAPFMAEIAWLRATNAKKLNLYRPTGTQVEEAENINLDANAQNLMLFNKIEMFLGMMLPPFYDTKYPMAVKYGGVGSVIGHELIHSFDDLGLTLPSLAHKHDWLSERARKEFQKQKACLVKEYSKYCLPDQAFCINGKRNVGENMADVDGLKIAYTAFKFAKQVHGADPAIPSMLNYTDDQLFFITNARTWCARGWNEEWRYKPHSPQKARIDVTMAHNPTFARSFRCTVGSKYAPFKACSVWGDLVNPAANIAAAAARKRRSSGGK